jgi:hypothetical protein
MIAPSNIGDNHWPYGGIDTARDHRLIGVVISRFRACDHAARESHDRL